MAMFHCLICEKWHSDPECTLYCAECAEEVRRINEKFEAEEANKAPCGDLDSHESGECACGPVGLASSDADEWEPPCGAGDAHYNGCCSCHGY